LGWVWVGLGHGSTRSPGSGLGWVGYGSMEWTDPRTTLCSGGSDTDLTSNTVGRWIGSRRGSTADRQYTEYQRSTRSAASARSSSTFFVGGGTQRPSVHFRYPAGRRSSTPVVVRRRRAARTSPATASRRSAAAVPDTRSSFDGHGRDYHARYAGAHRVTSDRTQPSSESASAAPGTSSGTEGRQNTECYPAGVHRHLDSVQRVRYRTDVLRRLRAPASLRVRSVVMTDVTTVIARCTQQNASFLDPETGPQRLRTLLLINLLLLSDSLRTKTFFQFLFLDRSYF